MADLLLLGRPVRGVLANGSAYLVGSRSFGQKGKGLEGRHAESLSGSRRGKAFSVGTPLAVYFIIRVVLLKEKRERREEGEGNYGPGKNPVLFDRLFFLAMSGSGKTGRKKRREKPC